MDGRHVVPPPPARPWSRSRILNVWVDDLSVDELMSTLDRGTVFTLNPHHLYHLQRDRRFYDAYRQADFITADSRYIFSALKWMRRGVKEKISGSDIVPEFCWRRRDDHDVKVFLLGAADGVAAAAQQRINERCGRDVVVGALSPSMRFGEDADEVDRVIDTINHSGATVLVVGMGAPKQEIWIAENKHRMPGIKVRFGVGSTIDYEAGAVKRAPVWMRERGLEWVYRVVTQPRRYARRYLRDVEFLLLVPLDKFGLYKSPLPIPSRQP